MSALGLHASAPQAGVDMMRMDRLAYGLWPMPTSSDLTNKSPAVSSASPRHREVRSPTSNATDSGAVSTFLSDVWLLSLSISGLTLGSFMHTAPGEFKFEARAPADSLPRPQQQLHLPLTVAASTVSPVMPPETATAKNRPSRHQAYSISASASVAQHGRGGVLSTDADVSNCSTSTACGADPANHAEFTRIKKQFHLKELNVERRISGVG